MSLPMNSMLPASTSISRSRQRARVDLPQPDFHQRSPASRHDGSTAKRRRRRGRGDAARTASRPAPRNSASGRSPPAGPREVPLTAGRALAVIRVRGERRQASGLRHPTGRTRVSHIDEGGPVGAAAGDGEGATRVELASGGQGIRRGRLAADRLQPGASRADGPRHRFHQSARVGMAGVLQQCARRAGLHDAPRIHHADCCADLAEHAKVVADQQDQRAESSWFSRRYMSRIRAWTVTSKAVVGSSAISNCGVAISAVVMVARWRIPPENSCDSAATPRAHPACPWHAAARPRAAVPAARSPCRAAAAARRPAARSA